MHEKDKSAITGMIGSLLFGLLAFGFIEAYEVAGPARDLFCDTCPACLEKVEKGICEDGGT
jgi:hypothetical protein